MNDIKLKLRPGHKGGRDWMADFGLRQLFWNVTYACNFRCQVCFSSSGEPAPDELTTEEAKAMVRQAHEAGVKDIVISGGEPFLRDDMVEILACMGALGITGRIASNGSLIDEALIKRLCDETAVKSFQISLDTLDRDIYEEIHGVPAEYLDRALEALRYIKAGGFHTTVSVRLTPRVIGGIPDLLDRAAAEGWSTVTIHCPVCTGRAEGVWPEGTDQVAALAPVFEHFLKLSEHWVVETNTPWARYHPTMRKLSKKITVAHEGCGGGRWRLAIGASGWISTCICLDLPAFRIANVRTDDIGDVFRNSRFADLMRRPQEYGLCTDCGNVATCGAGCRAAAYALTGDPEGLDLSCPVRQGRMRVAGESLT